jgi:hypothetical protein
VARKMLNTCNGIVQIQYASKVEPHIKIASKWKHERRSEASFHEAAPWSRDCASELRTAPQKMAFAGIDHFIDGTGI